jgi:predicted amidophosphoribosyltransferase
MPTVAELSEPYENFMLGPRAGPDVCEICFNFTRGFRRCYACTQVGQSIQARTRDGRSLDGCAQTRRLIDGCAEAGRWIEVVAPISYSVAHEQLHHALAAYKRVGGEVGRQLSLQLAAVLWRSLAAHERCVARAAGISSFDLVATVPSGDRARDQSHPLRRIVGEIVAPTRDRHRRLLRRSEVTVGAHTFHPQKFVVAGALNGQSVLLIDDTWTTGASARSAAAALRAVDSGPIAVVVLGRHLNRQWHENDRRLRGICGPFDWSSCALCGRRVGAAAVR